MIKTFSMKSYRRFMYDEKPGETTLGATAIEYGLIVALVAVAVITAIAAALPSKEKRACGAPQTEQCALQR